MTQDPALLVELTRGDLVESRHWGHAVIIDTSGQVVAGWGDVNALIYPRSSIKPLLALVVVESGAADQFQMTDRELAITMASHHSEKLHGDTVAGLLARLGLSDGDLKCGARRPITDAVWQDHLRSGTDYTARYDQCSGKHSGMLATCVAMRAPVETYLDPAHPVQQRVLGILERMTAQDLSGTPIGSDGCNAPNWAVPLGGLAFGMASFGRPDDQPEARQEACSRLRQAWAAEPMMISGTEGLDTAIARITNGRVLTKGGAEGVQMATIPSEGLGIALKIEDGAKRAASHAILTLLQQLDVLSSAEEAELLQRFGPILRNGVGQEIGEIRASEALSGNAVRIAPKPSITHRQFQL